MFWFGIVVFSVSALLSLSDSNAGAACFTAPAALCVILGVLVLCYALNAPCPRCGNSIGIERRGFMIRRIRWSGPCLHCQLEIPTDWSYGPGD